MDYGDGYVSHFMQYLNNFVANIRPDDPLPVRAPSYKVTEAEIDGQIIDIVLHYLNHRECPPYIRSYVAHQVWSAIRDPNSNGREDEECDMLDHGGGNQTFEPIKLIQDVTNRANQILVELQSTLSPSQVEALPHYLPVSQYAIKNTRRKMEDRHVILQDLNTLYDLDYGHPHAFYGVFDGHAGTDAAVYCAAHLHQYLIQNPLYGMDPASALKHAFCCTDTSFTKKVQKERLKGGTTAVVALIREKRLVVAWVGDSQALLVRKRTPVEIVHPHKPEKESERKRIEDQGGCVVNIQGTWRVLGQLAVSRAIGDVDYKPFVSSECDIKSLDICGDEDFLVLGCDGLWDTLEPEQVVNIVYAYLNNNSGDTDGVCRCLTEAARVAGSEDNITAVVVFLRPVHILMEEEATRIEQGQVPEMDSVPYVMTQKDSLPPSINAIFSQPSNLNPESPPFTPYEQSNGNLKNGNIDLPQDVIRNETLPNASVPQEVIIHDSDSDEGVGADIAAERTKLSPEVAAAVPTEEEVDAALAELDSLPDGAGDTGDVDEEDEEEEGWAYYKMEPQNEAQKEDIISGEAFKEKVVSEASEDILPVTSDPIDVVTKVESPLGSPKSSGSPRAVEGFVTSVELNTPEESYNTNLTINQTTEYFNGGGIPEQNSGPFSVYVSSSPEPASMDASPVHTQASMNEEFQEEDLPKSPSVEIVHAQSTVEVSPGDAPSTILMPDMMTQSISGAFPSEPFIPSPDVVLCRESSPTIVEDIEETTRNFDQLLSEAKHFEDFEASTDITPEFDQVTTSVLGGHSSPTFTKQDIEPMEHRISEESSMLINELESTVNEVSSVVAESHHVLDHVMPTEAPQTIDAYEEDKAQFTHNISKAFDAPLDEMLQSYHEDQNPLSDIIQVDHCPQQSPIAEEHSICDASNSQPSASEVEQIVEKVAQIELNEQSPAVESVVASEIPASEELITVDTPEIPASEDLITVDTPVVTSEIPASEDLITVDTPVATSEETVILDKIPVDDDSITSPAEIIEAPKQEKEVSKVSPPTPSPRTVGTKTSVLKPKSAPLPASRTTTTTAKKPALTKTAATSKTAAPKLSSTTTRSRPATSLSGITSRTTSATTSRLGVKPTPTSSTVRSKSSSATTATRTTSSSAARTKVTTATSTKPSTLPPTRMSLALPRKAPATATKSPSATSTTKPASKTLNTSLGAPKPKVAASSMASRAANRTTLAATSRLTSSTAAPKKPTSTTDKSTTATKSSATTTARKPISATTRPSSTTKLRPTTATKDTKNSTNKLLSTSKTSTTTSRVPPSRTAPTTKTVKVSSTRTTKTGLKPKETETKREEKKLELEATLANGEENKIVDEESSVEVKEKMLEEEQQLILPEENLPSAVDEGITKETEILVNGDH